jgi:hypothetical protein
LLLVIVSVTWTLPGADAGGAGNGTTATAAELLLVPPAPVAVTK